MYVMQPCQGSLGVAEVLCSACRLLKLISVVCVCRHPGKWLVKFATQVPVESEGFTCRVPSETLASALQQGHPLPTAALPHSSPGKVNPSAHLQQNNSMRRFSDSGVRADRREWQDRREWHVCACVCLQGYSSSKVPRCLPNVRFTVCLILYWCPRCGAHLSGVVPELPSHSMRCRAGTRHHVPTLQTRAGSLPARWVLRRGAGNGLARAGPSAAAAACPATCGLLTKASLLRCSMPACSMRACVLPLCGLLETAGALNTQECHSLTVALPMRGTAAAAARVREPRHRQLRRHSRQRQPAPPQRKLCARLCRCRRPGPSAGHSRCTRRCYFPPRERLGSGGSAIRWV